MAICIIVSVYVVHRRQQRFSNKQPKEQAQNFQADDNYEGDNEEDTGSHEEGDETDCQEDESQEDDESLESIEDWNQSPLYADPGIQLEVL